MKVPMRWLNEYVQVDMPVDQYAAKMVMCGTGVEGVELTGEGFDCVVVGKIVGLAKHENSDHLLVCQVDVGDEVVQIVTGAPNVFEGACVPVALVGARLPGGVAIKRGKLRGVESNGMLCSGPELEVPEGLYPHCGDEGILIFREEYAPGTDVKEVFGLHDHVVDFEILANRPDCLSVWGIARETAAALDEHLVMPEIAVQECAPVGRFEDYASVTVLDDRLCPRYCARVIVNVKIGPSPKWMREYLYGAGVRPINNIVDITNFIMLETGHPMHAFDLEKVRDQKIVVRCAHPGERLTTLDGKEHPLAPDMLVIADAEHATGLAGIMGGAESEITDSTTRVLFECAAFERTGIRLTARALGIRTESSGRFEKGVCPATAREALERACMLVNMLECGDVAMGAYDNYPHPEPERVVRAEVRRIAELTGVSISGEEMQDILARLLIDSELENGALDCRAPAWRMDIETDADIAEEVLRLYGYDAIPSTLMSGATMVGARSKRQKFVDRVKAAMVGMGFYETTSFSFVSPKWLNSILLPGGDARLDPVLVRNPLGEDTSAMRTSLAPSMLSVMSLNINRGNPTGRLFEVAPVFLKRAPGELPEERWMLSIGMYGEGVDFYALRDAAACLLGALGIAPEIEAGGDMTYHPGRKACLYAGDALLGRLGEVHPDAAGNFDINRRVYMAQLNLDVIVATAKPVGAVVSLPKFPAISRDLALVVDEGVPIGPLMAAIRASGGGMMEDVQLFDMYRGAQLGEAKKSAAFALSFRAPDRTLTDAEIQSAMERILMTCAERFGAKIRS